MSAPLSIPDILDTIRADFAARSITAEVLFGAWKQEWNNAGDRVVVGMGDFTLDAPGLPNAPGVQWIDDESGARALFTRLQGLRVWVHAQPPAARDPRRSENAQQATAVLLHQVLRALYVACHGSLTGGRGSWPNEDGQDFLYGSLATLLPEIAIPVLDDAMQAVAVDAEGSTTVTVSVNAEGGEEVVAVTPEPAP